MNYRKITILALCLLAGLGSAKAQNVTMHKQGGVKHVYEVENVDSVVYFPIGDTEPFPTEEKENFITLWDAISARPELNKFAQILRMSGYYSQSGRPYMDPEKSGTAYKMNQVLGSSIPMVVYAPTDDAISSEHYEQLLGMAMNDGSRLQQEFIFNHLYLQGEAGLQDTITMMNGKRFVSSEVPVAATDDVSNGRLYTISSVLPYRSNLDQYLRQSGTKASEFYASRDTVFFDPSSSVQSIPDINGNPTYLDSVYTTTTHMFPYSYLPEWNSDAVDVAVKGFGANLAEEDSSFIMCIPSDNAWNEAVQKLKSYYRYPAKYVDMTKRTKRNLSSSDYDRIVADTAALSDMSVMQDILAPAVFNIHGQRNRYGDIWEFVNELRNGNVADYILNTRGDSLFNTGDSEGNSWMLTSLFNGEMKEMSNGVAFICDEWAFPAHYYKPDVEVDVNGNFFQKTNMDFYRAGSSSKLVSFNNATYSDLTERFGKVYNNNFYYFENFNGRAFRVEIPLEGNVSDAYVPNAQVRSGKYDIYAVIVPLFYKDIANKGMDSLFYASDEEIMEYVKTNNYYTRFQVLVRCNDVDKEVMWKAYHPSGTKSDASGNTFQVEGMDACKVTTVKLIEDFEFPTSYAGMRWTFPTLQIMSAGKSATETAPGYSFDLCIDKIILKSKETGEEKVIRPSNY